MVVPGLDRVAGAEQQVIALAKGLKWRGWRVSIVALSGHGGSAARELRAAGIEFLSLEMRKGLLDPRGWFRFNRWLCRERPQIVHAHLPHAAWLTRWSRLCIATHDLSDLGSPATIFIDTLHSSSTGSCIRRFGYRASRWLTDCVTAVSQSVADAHSAARMVDHRKLTILHNGVDVEHFQPDACDRARVRGELGLNDEFLWLATGRLEPVKDYATLLHAFALQPQNTRLLIAGEGSQHGSLCQLSANLGIERRVRFLGFQHDVKPWLHAADAFVLSSRWEGLPVGLIEAGACGLPAVATDVPGSREVVVPGRTGLLVPSGSHEALAQAMTAIALASPRERQAMGHLARLHVLDRFSLDSMLDRWETLYGTLMVRGYLPECSAQHPVSA